MLQISELEFSISKNGSLLIPSSVLKGMGLEVGATVQVAYLTHDGITNTFQEFMLSSNAADEPDGEGDDSIRIPMRLMVQANISEDADLQIVCFDGCIAILRDASLQPGELRSVLEAMQKAEGLVSALPSEMHQVLPALEHTIYNIQRGAESDE